MLQHRAASSLRACSSMSASRCLRHCDSRPAIDYGTMTATMPVKRQKLEDSVLLNSANDDAPPQSLSATVLQGKTLQIIGQYVDAQTLVALTSTSRAWHDAFSSDTVWEHSSWHITPRTVKKVYKTYVPSTLQRLRQLSFDDEAEWKRAEIVFMSRLPTNAMLTSALGVQSIDAALVTNNFQSLRTLQLRQTYLPTALLNALSQLPVLERLELLECGMETPTLTASLSSFQHSTHIHMHCERIVHTMLNTEHIRQLLAASHCIDSFQIELSGTQLGDIEQDGHETFFSHPPPASKLRTLTFTLGTDNFYDVGTEPEYDFERHVCSLLDYYPSLTELDLSEQYEEFCGLDWEQMSMVTDRCREKHITLLKPPDNDTDDNDSQSDGSTSESAT